MRARECAGTGQRSLRRPVARARSCEAIGIRGVEARRVAQYADRRICESEVGPVRDEREVRIYEIFERNPRFKPQAFFFIFMALARCRLTGGQGGHVSGKELLKAFADEARSQYGPMAINVLNHMGFQCTRDVGELVFLMVAEGLLSKTDQDDLGDFENGYDFEEEFVSKYMW